MLTMYPDKAPPGVLYYLAQGKVIVIGLIVLKRACCHALPAAGA
jgi:hypothetical protein